MRGLCDDSKIDKFWVPQNNKNNHDPLFYAGLISSMITYNPLSEEWNMVVPKRPVALKGTSETTLHSNLLGRSTWLVQNDGIYYLRAPTILEKSFLATKSGQGL